LESLQNVAETLKNSDEKLCFDFIEKIKTWLNDDNVFAQLLENADLHIVHDTLESLEKICEIDKNGSIKTVFCQVEKLSGTLKKMISQTKPDFIKFSISFYLYFTNQ